MSWLSPRHMEDASRVLRGLAKVLAQGASDSSVVRRTAAADYAAAVRRMADILQPDAAASAPFSTAHDHTQHPQAATKPFETPPFTPEQRQGQSQGQAGSRQQDQALGAGPSVSPFPAGPMTGTASPQGTLGSGAADAAATAGGVAQQAGMAAAGMAASLGGGAWEAAARAGAAAAGAAGLDMAAGAANSTLRSAGDAAAGAADATLTRGAGAATGAGQAGALAVDAAAVSGSMASEAAGTATAPVVDAGIPVEAMAADSAAVASASAADAAQKVSSMAGVPEGAPSQSREAQGHGARQAEGRPLNRAGGEGAVAATAAPASARAQDPESSQQQQQQQQGGEGEEQKQAKWERMLGGTQPALDTSGPGNGVGAGEADGAGNGESKQQPRKLLRERRVPESAMGRAFGFAAMGASLMFGSVTDSLGRAWTGPADKSSSGNGNGGNSFLSQGNAERLADALCRMRGAALKIGQMLSIQDENVLPPQVQAALERVRQGADVMPRAQLDAVLVSELGSDWRDKMAEFEDQPCAAASIGQVHRVTLHDGRLAAMKVQYPGVARSIESDVDNLMRLISVANILPKGLYVHNAVKVAKRELALECDYTWELKCQAEFRELVLGDPELRGQVNVPAPIAELSTGRIMTSEWVKGVPIDQVIQLDQAERDHVGTLLLRLTLKELFDWHFMQTDPNWGNFLYDHENKMLNLIDFGAARHYPASFVDQYLEMVAACAERDTDRVVEMSKRLGFLTGDEAQVMLDAHCEAGFVVGMPFRAQGLYDFGSHGNMTGRVSELGSVMLKHRLTPPPDESYSLHRKLSGAFLACMKLKARVPCRKIFYDTYHRLRERRQAAGLLREGQAEYGSDLRDEEAHALHAQREVHA